MIYTGSRYIGCYTMRDSDNQVDFLSFPEMNNNQKSDLDRVYQVQTEDRLDLLAEKFYGDPQLGWIILKANPVLTSELDLTAGLIITIPYRSEVD